MAGLLAYLTLRMTAALKSAALVYGLMGLGALIFIFASGYALNAGYTALMFRYGPIAASLTIAGGLLAVAIACVIAARVVGNRTRTPSVSLPAEAHVHLASLPVRQRAITAGFGLAGAATVALAIITMMRRRLQDRDEV